MCTRVEEQDFISVAPIAVFPSQFPRKCFELAKEVQVDCNLLMHKVAHDNEFLASSLKSTNEVDEFTRNIFDIHEKVLKAGVVQPLSFGLFRSDYMVDESHGKEPRIRQIEVNAIASSFVGLATKISRLHKHLISKYGTPKDLQRLPHNDADKNFAASFVDAWEAYGNPSAVILFVTEDKTVNICDQRSLEFEISALRPDIKVIRRSLATLLETAKIRGNQLLFADNLEVALVYYRVGYDPKHYPTQEYWELRLLIERTKAIKCPSINYHLAGVKKLQQLLADKDVLERFLEPSRAEKLSQTFAGLWGFDMGPKGDEAVELALSDPGRFVMKPQREGGGNNIYGNDIIAELTPIKGSSQREAYILMEMIRPPTNKNLLIGPNIDIDPSSPFHQIVSELGIYGAIMGTSDQVVFNSESGHVLRSKKSGVNEGGIAAGFGAVDSPILY